MREEGACGVEEREFTSSRSMIKTDDSAVNQLSMPPTCGLGDEGSAVAHLCAQYDAASGAAVSITGQLSP